MFSRLGLRFISKALRSRVWLQYNGDRFHGKCYCCGKPITAHFFEAAHVQARSKGGPDKLHNLRPTCTPCNREMKTENLYVWMGKKFKK